MRLQDHGQQVGVYPLVKLLDFVLVSFFFARKGGAQAATAAAVVQDSRRQEIIMVVVVKLLGGGGDADTGCALVSKGYFIPFLWWPAL